ncbi:MAG: hypothetical protein HC850_00750 [Rhodomicrobium sp.]|nr:hypothetical protein [Rhodomicrobium sp.]
MRNALRGSICAIALILTACSRNDPATIVRVEGVEPQRLSFGAPAVVQKSFTDHMRACWFDGPSAPLTGYRYDTKPAVLETGSGLSELPQVTITSGQGSQAQSFIIQFYPFNENTLISTRNISFPVELAAKMKRDVETWIFGRTQCDDPVRQEISAPGPQISATPVQQASVGGWSPSQEARYTSSIR